MFGAVSVTAKPTGTTLDDCLRPVGMLYFCYLMVLIVFLTKQSLSYASCSGVMRSSSTPTALIYEKKVCLSNIFMTATVVATNMTRYCLKCEASMRTIYPRYGKTRFVQRICDNCGWSARPIQIPDTRRDMTKEGCE